MYNYVRRCVIVSVKIHQKFLTQSIYESDLSTRINYYIHRWNNAAYKRFCCEAAIKTKDDEAKIHPEDFIKQKFDQFLSNPENKKLYDILQLEIEVLRSNAELVPEKIKADDWLMLFTKKSKTQRKKFLQFLYKAEKTHENLKAKKEKEREIREAKWQEKCAEAEKTGEIRYGLFQNSLFLRIYTKTMQDWYNARLIRNMMFEPKIVFDCDYEQHMTPSEIHNCAKQLTMAFAHNRVHDGSLCIYYCNLKKDGLLKQYFHRNMPNLMDDDFPAIITSQSYLELFPKDQLVYLTPHCRTDLTEYDPDMTYIIGAMVDKTNPLPFSMAKAKKEGIRMAKLPLEKYLKWGSSSTKNLTIDQMMAIFLDLKHTRSWDKALQHIPRRKLKDFRDNALQRTVEKFSRSRTQDSQDTKFNVQTKSDFTFASRKKM